MARIKPQALLQQSKKKKAPNRISLTTIVFFSLIILLVLFCVFSTFRYFSSRSVIQGDQTVYFGGRKGLGNLMNPDVPRYVTLKTSKGLIAVELLKDNAPEIVDEFIGLCEKGHFKGMQFHRIIRNFVVQIGDADSLGTEEDWTSRTKQFSDVEKTMKHEVFLFGTSKEKHDAKRFELYITTAPIPDLNEKLIVFGQVVRGVEVVQEIEEVEIDEKLQPKSPIPVLEVTLQHTI